MRNLGFSTKYLNFSEKVKDKVKNKIKELQNRAQTISSQRIAETIDEKLYSFLDGIEGLAWKIRNVTENSLWRTRRRLKRIVENSQNESDDLDLLLLLGGEK